MRSIFCKLFLSFIFITLFASITTAMISYFAQIGPYAELQKRVQNHQLQTLTHTLSVAGLAVEKILQNGSKDEVISYLQDIEKTNDSRILLLNEENSSFSGRPLPPTADDLATASRSARAAQYNVSEAEIMVALPIFNTGRQPMVILGNADRIFWPPALAPGTGKKQLLGGRVFHMPLGLPLLVMLLIAATGCYLLARSLTAPIRNLRQAVQRITKGDFSARVDLLSRSKDEIADLSRDFNTMAERTQTLLKSQKRLLRDISHELRSPLTRQNIALELARQRPGDSAPYLTRIAKESDRINELIDQLLLLTRLEGDVDNAAKKPVSLQQLVNAIVHDADFEAAGKDRRIEVRDFDDVTVLGSREMLGRALENVIRNGLRYTKAGSAVEISLGEDDGHAILLVKDHGPGVPQDYLEQIFKPFFRVAESRDRDSGGTGIGLAIAKQAILLHGGRIAAKNSAEGGLIIEMRLPIL